MLFGLGEGGGKSAGAGWAGQRGPRVGMTGLGGIKALRAGQWIEAGCTESNSGVTSSGSSVRGRGWSGAELVVEAEEL